MLFEMIWCIRESYVRGFFLPRFTLSSLSQFISIAVEFNEGDGDVSSYTNVHATAASDGSVCDGNSESSDGCGEGTVSCRIGTR